MMVEQWSIVVLDSGRNHQPVQEAIRCSHFSMSKCFVKATPGEAVTLRQGIGWCVVWLVGRLVDWLVGWLVSSLVDW